MSPEAGKAKPCLSPPKAGEFGFAPPEGEIKSMDLHRALTFCFFFVKKKEEGGCFDFGSSDIRECLAFYLHTPAIIGKNAV